MSESGTLIGVLTIGPSWPPVSSTELYARTGGSGDVRVHAQSDGRLMVTVARGSGEDSMSVLSPPLTIEGESDIPLTAIWNWETPQVSLRLFDSIWFHPEDRHSVAFPVPPRASALPNIVKVGDPKAEQEKRAEWARAKASTMALFGEAESELAAEIEQLGDLIGMIGKNPNHIRGAISIVRKLVADQQPLLQLVAGKLNKPLVVFGNSDRPPPDISMDFMRPRSFVLRPQWGHRFHMDLETWLEQVGGVFEGAVQSNRNTIKAIADKIGAHVDLRARSTVDALLRGSSFRGPDLHSFVVDLSKSVVELAKQVLSDASAQADLGNPGA